MRWNGIVVQLGLILSLALFAAPAWAGDDHDDEDEHGHADDFIVGVIFANPEGQIEAEFDFDEIFELPEIDGVITGFALDDPGFASLDEDEPDEGIFMLDPTTEIVFELVSSDPAFKIHTPGFADILVAPGDQWLIGAPPFDEHVTWHIDTTDPSYDPGQIIYPVTFRLLDVGATGYAPSEDFTVMFTNAECDLHAWNAEDCNLNGVADVCELEAFGTDVDANENGVIDDCDCEVQSLIPGDTNGDGESTLADVVFLAEALFTGGSPPQNVFLADLDGDGLVVLFDVIYLAQFLFSGGDAPVEPCL